MFPKKSQNPNRNESHSWSTVAFRHRQYTTPRGVQVAKEILAKEVALVIALDVLTKEAVLIVIKEIFAETSLKRLWPWRKSKKLAK